jgi:ABC-2 type transport system ATP-binding protein
VVNLAAGMLGEDVARRATVTKRGSMTTRSQPAIRATGLRKSFGDKLVLDGIDLEVAEGTIFSLLGPNGAGKTTTVQILSTLIGADGGEVRVAGHDLARDPDSVRAAIGVTGHLTEVGQIWRRDQRRGHRAGRSL